jgi:hypothetical protein
MPRRALTVVAAALIAACSTPAPETSSYVVTFTARADEPLAGVEIGVVGGPSLGTTAADGTLRVDLTGAENTAVPLRVTCPAGYRTLAAPELILRRFTGLDPAAAERGLEVSIACPPSQRMAALVIKTGRPGLPVIAQGREVARTDARGYAHAVVAVPPETTVQVVLDTRGDPRLQPASPMSIVSIKDADEIVVIDRPFEVPPPPGPPPPTAEEIARAKAKLLEKLRKKKPRPKKKPKEPEKPKGPIRLQ